MVFFRAMRRRLGLQWSKFRVMWVVAAGAEIIGSFARTGKVSYSFPVNACLPVLVLVSVTFSTEPIAFRKADQIPVIEPQPISIFRIMAVETPPHRFGVMEFDIDVFFCQISLLPIHLHRGMAVCARKYSFCHWRGTNRKFFTRAAYKRHKTNR